MLILTDMFGGTPSNLSYSFLEERRVEVISGVNLPILIQAINKRNEMSIAELCRKEGIVQNLYYRWSKEFLGSMGGLFHWSK